MLNYQRVSDFMGFDGSKASKVKGWSKNMWKNRRPRPSLVMFCQARAAALEELAARWDAKQIWCRQGWPDRLLGVFMVNSTYSTGKMMIDSSFPWNFWGTLSSDLESFHQHDLAVDLCLNKAKRRKPANSRIRRMVGRWGDEAWTLVSNGFYILLYFHHFSPGNLWNAITLVPLSSDGVILEVSAGDLVESSDGVAAPVVQLTSWPALSALTAPARWSCPAMRS